MSNFEQQPRLHKERNTSQDDTKRQQINQRAAKQPFSDEIGGNGLKSQVVKVTSYKHEAAIDDTASIPTPSSSSRNKPLPPIVREDVETSEVCALITGTTPTTPSSLVRRPAQRTAASTSRSSSRSPRYKGLGADGPSQQVMQPARVHVHEKPTHISAQISRPSTPSNESPRSKPKAVISNSDDDDLWSTQGTFAGLTIDHTHEQHLDLFKTYPSLQKSQSLFFESFHTLSIQRSKSQPIPESQQEQHHNHFRAISRDYLTRLGNCLYTIRAATSHSQQLHPAFRASIECVEQKREVAHWRITGFESELAVCRLGHILAALAFESLNEFAEIINTFQNEVVALERQDRVETEKRMSKMSSIMENVVQCGRDTNAQETDDLLSPIETIDTMVYTMIMTDDPGLRGRIIKWSHLFINPLTFLHRLLNIFAATSPGLPKLAVQGPSNDKIRNCVGLSLREWVDVWPPKCHYLEGEVLDFVAKFKNKKEPGVRYLHQVGESIAKKIAAARIKLPARAPRMGLVDRRVLAPDLSVTTSLLRFGDREGREMFARHLSAMISLLYGQVDFHDAEEYWASTPQARERKWDSRIAGGSVMKRISNHEKALTLFVIESCMDARRSSQRARVISFWVRVAEACAAHRNFSTPHSIFFALQTRAISRMLETVLSVSVETKIAFQRLRLLFEDGFSGFLQEAYSKDAPYVPVTAWLIDEAFLATKTGRPRDELTQGAQTRRLRNIIRGKHLASACYVLEIDETIGPWLDAKMQQWIKIASTATEAEYAAVLDDLYQTSKQVELPNRQLIKQDLHDPWTYYANIELHEYEVCQLGLKNAALTEEEQKQQLRVMVDVFDYIIKAL